MKQGVSFILNLLSYISEMTFRLPPHQMYQWNFKFSYSGIRACVYILLNILACTIYVVRFFATPRTVACYAALSIEFSRQEYWSRVPFPSPKHTCMLSHFSCVRLCVTPWTAAHQAPLSMGFSRQEHWSGLPFPPPMHESEKSKWSRSVVSDS